MNARGDGGGDVLGPSWRNRVALAALVWVLACAGAWVWGLEPKPGLLALVTAAAAGVVWLYLDVSGEAERATWDRVSDDPVRAPGEDPRLSLLRRVISGHLDAKDTDDQLHRHLLAVADERLMAHHGITRSASPEHAAAVLGPDLNGFLHGPRTRRLNAAQIGQLLNRIEKL